MFADYELTGVTLCCDSWTNTNGDGVTNFLLVSPKGAVFDSAVSSGAERQTGEWYAEHM